MHEINLIRTLFGQQAKRTLDLIISSVTYNGSNGALGNDHWHYRVPFAFRDALDIRYDKRVKGGRQYDVWTQGPFISFSAGDVLTSKDGTACVQVEQATSVVWDVAKGMMNEGTVIYKKFSISEHRYTEIATATCSQIEFLAMLIGGK